MDETIRQANIDLQAENRNLHTLITSLHEKYHTMSLKVLHRFYTREAMQNNSAPMI